MQIANGSEEMNPVENPERKRNSKRVKDSQYTMLLENLITFDELCKRLEGKYTRGTLYKITRKAPKSARQKYRGRLYFDPRGFDQWLERTS